MKHSIVFAISRRLALRDRLQKIYSPNLEETALIILEKIGKINRVYLTNFEEQLLVLLETKFVG